MGQSLLSPSDWVDTPLACEKPGSGSLNSGPQLPQTAPPQRSAARPRGRGRWGRCRGGRKQAPARPSRLNSTGFSSAWAPGCSGSHRMRFSAGGDVYAPPFTTLFLTSVCTRPESVLSQVHTHTWTRRRTYARVQAHMDTQRTYARVHAHMDTQARMHIRTHARTRLWHGLHFLLPDLPTQNSLV